MQNIFLVECVTHSKCLINIIINIFNSLEGSVVFVERSAAQIKTGWLIMATGTRNSRAYKVTATERGGMKSEVNVEGEKKSRGREPEVRKMRRHEGLM